jgi:hypothetical protein
MLGTTTFEAIVVLMIKFGKSEKKIGCSGFLFRTVRFQQFQNINMA